MAWTSIRLPCSSPRWRSGSSRSRATGRSGSSPTTSGRGTHCSAPGLAGSTGPPTGRFDRPPDPELEPERDRHTLGLFETNLRQRIEAALEERRLIDAELPPEIRADTPDEYAYKEDRLRGSEARLAEARLLMDLRSAAPFVAGIWRELPAIAGAPDPAAASRQRPWWAEFERVQARERFFHWELEFPEVLLREDRPGFDFVLGNPPWDKVLPSKLEFYGAEDPVIRAFKGNELETRIRELQRRRPGLARAFEAERERTTTIARILRRGGDFPLAEARSGAAHEDLAKYFVDRALRLVREGGAVGLVVPSVLYNGDGAVGIRRFLLSETRIERFYGFENRRRVFPIDSRYKFANLVARKGADRAGGFTAAFMRHDVAELESPESKPWEVRITRSEVERLSPETLALLEYRGPRDQEIVAKMHAGGRPTLGADGPSGWGARLMSWRAHETVFNTSEDKDLFTDPRTDRLHAPEAILDHAPRDPGETMERMRERGFWPVFEGKHVEQFLVGVKPIRWWLSVEQAERKYGRPPREEPTLVFRETASNTNERTCIAAVLPSRSAASHKLTGIVLDHVSPDAALAVLNSFCFDFALRLRTAGTNVSFTYILPVAVPPEGLTNSLPRLPTRFAWTAGLTHVSADLESWPALWEMNRAVAEAYGLDGSDLAHVFAAFPVFARKRPGLRAFLGERLHEWNAQMGA